MELVQDTPREFSIILLVRLGILQIPVFRGISFSYDIQTSGRTIGARCFWSGRDQELNINNIAEAMGKEIGGFQAQAEQL